MSHPDEWVENAGRCAVCAAGAWGQRDLHTCNPPYTFAQIDAVCSVLNEGRLADPAWSEGTARAVLDVVVPLIQADTRRDPE